MQIIKLHCADNSRFRLGSGSLLEVEDIVHSDTLFNGWMNAYLSLFGAGTLPQVLQTFQSGDCCCSSAFHFVDIFKGQDYVSTLYFVPKPLLRRISIPTSEESDGSIKKRIKKLKYVSLDLLQELLTSVKTDAEGELRFSIDLLALTIFADEYAMAESNIPTELLPHLPELKKMQFRCLIDAPKVAINRLSAQSDDIYYQTDCFFNWQQCGNFELRPGFYFLFQPPTDVRLHKRLSAALNLLADEGLGGERSSGAGFIERIEQKTFVWKLSGAYAMLLSLTLPGATNHFDQIINYQSIIRGGYLGTTGIRKNQVRMLREGSIVKLPFAGSIVLDSPTKSPASYRYAQAVYVQFGDGQL
ncbi:MAG TPA: type III-A CRISPR-associated RAMP protein Csm4 [bacterium]|nr:type III-A CRISPR-associated RAMP protein Csm4 [bacterium]